MAMPALTDRVPGAETMETATVDRMDPPEGEETRSIILRQKTINQLRREEWVSTLRELQSVGLPSIPDCVVEW
jgi:hypothetical protein